MLSTPSGPRLGQSPGSQQPRMGLVPEFCYNLCTAVSSCFYVFCCCWLVEDCFVGRRSFPGPPFGSPEPPRPPPPHVGPEPHGIVSPLLHQHDPPPGPPGPFGLPSFGSPEPPPPPPPHVGPGPHGIVGPLLHQQGPPPGPPGPFGLPS